jgi:hypothetical protein
LFLFLPVLFTLYLQAPILALLVISSRCVGVDLVKNGIKIIARTIWWYHDIVQRTMKDTRGVAARQAVCDAGAIALLGSIWCVRDFEISEK